MRSPSTGAAIALALLAAACSQRPDTTANSAEFKKDLASASIASNGLLTPPAKYERLRFVSDVEMSRTSEKAPRPKKSVHHDQMTPNRNDGPESNVAAAEEVITVAAESPSQVATNERVPLPPEPMIEEPVRSAGTSGGPSATGEHQGGSGRSIGSVLGAIFGNAVIRGGRGDDDKCDPRGARGHGRGTLAMPIGMGASGFPHHVYR